MILNIGLLNISHLYIQQNCIQYVVVSIYFVSMKINKNTANAYIHYEKYKQYYVYYTRTTYFFIII